MTLPRTVVLIGMTISVVTAILCGWAWGFRAFAILLFIQGFCQASGWAPLAKNLGAFFSQHERGRIMGLWCTNYAVGGFLGAILAGYAVAWFKGWQFAFWIPAICLVVIGILFFYLQENQPKSQGPDEEAKPTGGLDAAKLGLGLVRLVLRQPMVWLLGLVYFLVKPTRYFMLSWAPLYVNERFGATTAHSSLIGSMFDLAGPIGTLVGGILSDSLFQSKRMPMAVIALLLLAVLMVLFPFLPLNVVTVGMGFFGIGFLIYIPDSLISGTAAIDFGTKEGASTASGFINGCGSLGQVIGVMLPGLVGLNVKAGGDIWSPIFIGLGLALVLAAALLAPQWHRLPRNLESQG